MLAYILRRLLLVVPTLFGIMVVNFFIVQAAPGGPVEQMLAQIQGTRSTPPSASRAARAAARPCATPRPTRRAAAAAPIAARAACPRS